ncbi:MAG: hypothetical protein EOO09_00975 [Chitinophagaceae bacterium]|nr:MAG: hypothetical protein EOO09_00975 [Chitinophagaceae bacterium]
MWEFIDQPFFQQQDLYLVPACLLLLFMISYSIRKKYDGSPLRRYFLPALFLRFFFAVLYSLVVYYYYGFGDTSVYYRSIGDLRNAVATDSSLLLDIYFTLNLDAESPLYTFFMFDNGIGTHAYMLNLSNYTVPRFALPFSFLFNNSYLCISFCMGFFSFGGCWRVFRMFTEMYPHLHKKMAVAVLFLPSVLFWGGSLMKDSISIGCLGYMLYALYNLTIVRRKIVSSAVIVILSGALLYFVKPYILLCAFPTFLVWAFLRNQFLIKNDSVRMASAVFVGGLALAAGIFTVQFLTKSEAASQYSSDKILQTVQSLQGSFSADEGGSSFTVQQIDNSVLQFILLFPMGVVSTLFRPFLWEVRNPLMVLSALEALAFLYLTIVAFRGAGIAGFMKIVFKDPVLIFCLTFSILFAAIIGSTTTNFGALVRYKIPCIPFYLIMVFVVMDRTGKFSPDVVLHRKLF